MNACLRRELCTGRGGARTVLERVSGRQEEELRQSPQGKKGLGDGTEMASMYFNSLSGEDWKDRWSQAMICENDRELGIHS